MSLFQLFVEFQDHSLFVDKTLYIDKTKLEICQADFRSIKWAKDVTRARRVHLSTIFDSNLLERL